MDFAKKIVIFFSLENPFKNRHFILQWTNLKVFQEMVEKTLWFFFLKSHNFLLKTFLKCLFLNGFSMKITIFFSKIHLKIICLHVDSFSTIWKVLYFFFLKRHSRGLKILAIFKRIVKKIKKFSAKIGKKLPKKQK